MKRRSFLIFLALMTWSSCGYSTKSLYNKNFHTVAVPVFTNKSFRREWEFRLTEAVVKKIESRTPYMVTTADRADTVLTGEIVDIQENVLTERAGTELPRETQLTVVVNIVWKDRAGHVLLERKGLNRSATEIPQLGERVEDAEQLAVE